MRIDRNKNAMVAAAYASLAALMMCAAVKAHAVEIIPSRVIYAGGGVGWYHTTLDYNAPSPFRDETKQKFGIHAGGLGFKFGG